MRFVELSFKLKFMLRFCILVISGVLGAGLLFYTFTYRSLGRGYGDAVFTIYSVKKALLPILFASIESIILLCIVAAAIAVVSTFFSHKIAGPLYRLGKSLEAIGSGDLTINTKLRAKDQIVELANAINSLTRSLNHRIRGVKEGLSQIEPIEGRLKTLLDKDPTHEELKEVIDELKDGVSGLEKIISYINLKG
jgi:methyl-accepting chemotaxis protein